MAVLKLTAKAIAGLKAKPNGRRETYWDAVTRGLYVHAHASGKKTFGVFGRVDAHCWRVTLGEFREDVFGLADARQAANAVLREAAHGRDPVVEKRKRREAGTFGDLVESFLPAAQLRESTREEWGRLLRAKRLAALRAKPTGDVSRGDLVRLFDKIAADSIREGGKGYSANRTLEAVRRVFTWAIAKDLVAASPCVGITMPIKEKPRQRAYSDLEIGALVRALGDGQMDDAIRLCLWTGARIETALGAPVSEFALPLKKDGEVDVDNAEWNIDGVRAGSKNGLPWSVPLVRPAVEMLRARIGESPWLFPARPRKDSKLVKGGAAWRSQKAIDRIATAAGIDGFRPHDLRRTLNTWLASRAGGAEPLEVRDAILGHRPRGLESVYNVHSYAAEKRAALDRWASHVERIAAEKPAKVVAGKFA